MLTYFFIFLLLLFGGSLSLVSNDTARARAYAIYSFVALPTIWALVAFRSSTVNHDYLNYVDWFDSVRIESLGAGLLTRDPSFAVIAYVLSFLGLGIVALMGVYGLLTIATQVLFAKWLFPSRWIPIGIFLIFSRFLIPHEMTQIRAGLAIPLASLAIVLFARKKIWQGWVAIALASLFHASVLLVLPVILLILCRTKFLTRLWIAAMLPIAVAGNFLFSHASDFLSGWARLAVYLSGDYETAGIRLFSVYFLFRAIPLTIFCLWWWERLLSEQKLICFCSALGLCLQVTFSSNDAFAIRTAEIFGLFDVAVAIIVFQFLRPRGAFVYVLCLLTLGAIFFRSGTSIANPYETVWSVGH